MSSLVEGFGKEVTVRDYPSEGTPLLQSFYFFFLKNELDID